eukprot:TRINITY_DN7830_c0_g1_i1.p1 TRINITY_DN7830_c0_g1~~TRINITY_DN7830_c0_g1_i1.p1  ORF type:complete len:614 (-),score=103.18 TRINITY_DN7830_c0_g1_i1:121-1962(-)
MQPQPRTGQTSPPVSTPLSAVVRGPNASPAPTRAMSTPHMPSHPPTRSESLPSLGIIAPMISAFVQQQLGPVNLPSSLTPHSLYAATPLQPSSQTSFHSQFLPQQQQQQQQQHQHQHQQQQQHQQNISSLLPIQGQFLPGIQEHVIEMNPDLGAISHPTGSMLTHQHAFQNNPPLQGLDPSPQIRSRALYMHNRPTPLTLMGQQQDRDQDPIDFITPTFESIPLLSGTSAAAATVANTLSIHSGPVTRHRGPERRHQHGHYGGLHHSSNTFIEGTEEIERDERFSPTSPLSRSSDPGSGHVSVTIGSNTGHNPTQASAPSPIPPELGPLSTWIGQVSPFLLLLFFMFIYQHFRGLTTFLTFFYVFSRVDEVIRYEVSLRNERSTLHCSILVMILSSTFFWIQVFCKGSTTLLWIFLGHPDNIHFLNCLWVVVMNDMILTNLCMGAKTMYVVFCTKYFNSRKNAQNFAALEAFFKLIRFCMPIPIWGVYFTSYMNGDFIPTMVSLMYPIFKATELSNKYTTFKNLAFSQTSNEPQFGRPTDIETLDESERGCPICQESIMNAPLTLTCGHVFCDDCITRWFENNSTCPICRALIRTSQFKMHTDGSTSIMVQLF